MPELLALKTAVRTQGRPAQMRNYASEVTIHSGSSPFVVTQFSHVLHRLISAVH